jgi:hypothetical protein
MDPGGEDSSTSPPPPERRWWRRPRNGSGGLSKRHKHPLRAALVLAVLLIAGVGGALAATDDSDVQRFGRGALTGAASSKGACAGSTDATLSQTLGEIGTRLYHGELSRTGAVATAIASVTHSSALARAVAAGEPVATRAAVTGIVYNHLHIVRLRVIRNGRVLSDVGGPFVLAPLGGDIRLHGRVVGRYLLSIQDDLGYLLLSGRLGGMQVVLRSGGRQIMSSLRPAPVSLPAQGTATVGGTTYVTHEINATAFPSGPLQIYLLAPQPPPSLGSRTCLEIKMAALGNVGMHIAQRLALSPTDYRAYISVARDLTGAVVLIRAGSHQLASSVRSAPRHVPDEGTVRFQGGNYGVFSFPWHSSAGGPVRIFLLVRLA